MKPFMNLMHGWVLLAVITGSFTSLAEAQNDQALAKAQYLLRQVNAEKSQLQAQLTEQQKKAEALAEEVAALEKKLQASKAKSANNAEQYQENMQNYREALSKERTEVASLRTALREMREWAASLNQGLESCLATNKQYFDLSQELIASYEEKGFMDVFQSREALTGIGKVWMENQIQEYANKADDLELLRSDVVDDALNPGS